MRTKSSDQNEDFDTTNQVLGIEESKGRNLVFEDKIYPDSKTIDPFM